MNECLVTTLKSVVNDDNLHKLGDIIAEKRSDIENTSDYCYMKFASPDDLSVEIINDGQFCEFDSGTPNPSAGKTVVLPAEITQQIWVTMGTRFRIMPRYNMTEWSCNRTNINFDDFSYMSNLKNIYATFVNEVTGSLATIANLPVLESFIMSGDTGKRVQIYDTIEVFAKQKTLRMFGCMRTYVQGDLTIAFGSNTNIERLEIADTNITGSIESFVTAQIAAGRSNGSITIPYIKNCKLTFEGTPVSTNENVHASSNTISWTSDGTITWSTI